MKRFDALWKINKLALALLSKLVKFRRSINCQVPTDHAQTDIQPARGPVNKLEGRKKYNNDIYKACSEIFKNFKINVIQIGAGSTPRKMPPFASLNDGYLNFYLIEPNTDSMAEDVTGVSAEYLDFAVSDIEGCQDLYVYKNLGASSFFRPNFELLDDWFRGPMPLSPDFELTGVKKVKTTTLDKLFENNNLPECELIRLNIQGAELKAIQGGKLVFDNALAVQIELSFAETYIGAPMFSDIDPILRKLGFEFFDFLAPNMIGYNEDDAPTDTNLVWRSPNLRIFESHCLYLKSYKLISNDAQKIAKLAVLSELYGQDSYANFLYKKLINMESY